MKYTVKNKYGVGKETTHKTADAALKSRDNREGLGWIVVNDKGHTIDRDFEGRPCIID